MAEQKDIRSVLLSVIDRRQPRDQSTNLQSSSVLQEAASELGFSHNLEKEQALLTQFHELFRTGYLAWGLNLSNPNPPFFHLAAQGRKTLAQLSSDPGNPDGYMNRVAKVGAINPIARSYLEEGLHCYVAGLYKASAVMVGGAAESIILELRDATNDKLTALGRNAPKDLKDWRVSRVLQSLKVVFDAAKNNFPTTLRDEYEAYWPAFTQQIRAARNDAGHPSSVDPITPETVHASLLIFPELLRLSTELHAAVDRLT